MSNQRKLAWRICRRAAYFLSADSAQTIRIEKCNWLYQYAERDRNTLSKNCIHHMTIERQLIDRCYQIS